ncbi:MULTISPECIES: FMN-binding protein [unclassified Streptomyces]|uniref:FMN-binding protein n=1 Tax=unclassified Streptomyces TaxID=2593676 RepID=UPI002E2EB8FE|nr:FMN-binding protein [Streptomyces sp. NBC_01455]
MQVAAILSTGKITAVKVIQAPDQNGRAQQIASYALPRLTQKALGAQSAHIDAVSGTSYTSYTSQGYIQSLQSPGPGPCMTPRVGCATSSTS